MTRVHACCEAQVVTDAMIAVVVAAVVTGAMTVVAADTGVTVVVGAIATTAEDAATIATVHIDESTAVLADLYSPRIALGSFAPFTSRSHA